MLIGTEDSLAIVLGTIDFQVLYSITKSSQKKAHRRVAP